MIMAASTPENLQRFGRLLGDRTACIPIQATYELAQAPDALTAVVGHAHPREARDPHPMIIGLRSRAPSPGDKRPRAGPVRSDVP